VIQVSRRDNLDRYYLFKCKGFGIFIHHIHHDEPDSFHNHPWTGLSLILGCYREETFKTRRVKWFFNLVGKTPHRVTLPCGPVWTIFFHLPRNNQWKVFSRQGKVLSEEPWRGVGGRTNYS
jgi:hypothetical protein